MKNIHLCGVQPVMKLIMIILLAACLYGQSFSPLTQDYTMAGATGAVSSQAVNAATTWGGYLYIPSNSKTLNKASFYVSAVSGTLASSDIRAEVLGFLGASNLSFSTTVTYTDGSDTVNYTAHPFVNGDAVAFSQTGGALPAGIANDTTVYYVCNATANDFQIDDSVGCGSIVTDFSGSSGTNAVRRLMDASATVTATPTGAAWVEVTGLTTSLIAGSPYLIVVRNVNGTPASNNFTIRYLNDSIPGSPQRSNTQIAKFQFLNSTNNGTSFTVQGAATAGMRFEFSDATFAGIPVENMSAAGASDRANGTQEVGTRLTLAGSGATYTVVGATVCYNRVGSPTKSARVRVYGGVNGSEALLGTSNSIPPFMATTNSVCNSVSFSTVFTVAAGSVVRVMLGSTAAGDANTATHAPMEVTIHNNADSKTLIGSVQHAKFDGTSTWTYTDTKFVPVMLMFSATTAFTGAGSGGAFGYVK